jgi:DNA-binding response OmpR family regulator
MSALSDGTLRIAPDDGRRLAERRIGVRRKAFRIAAECELLMNELLLSEQRNWSDAFGSVLGAARRLIALTAPGSDSMFAADLRPTPRLTEVQSDMLSTINAVGAAAGTQPTDGAAIHGIQVIRELALGMFALSDEAATRPRDTVKVDEGSIELALREKVLIVDDDPSIARFLQRSLEAWDLAVTTATDGREALAIIGSNAFDLVLTDIEMPHLDGVSLLTAIKANVATRNIPVIVISSLDDMDIVSKCIELGAEDHISKPVAAQLLSARVKASLERKRLHDSETEGLRRIERLIEAAEAVERDVYSPDTLAEMRAAQDGLGQLARVFDRMVSGMKTREDRLRVRVERLRAEAREGRKSRALSGPITEDSPFAVGDIVAGRFEIVGQLGQGGMGTVYHARDAQLGEDVALKVVRRELISEVEESLERFKSEIRLARKISHPNVVRAHDIGEWQGQYFITMEKVHGETVAELIDRRGKFSVESTIAIGTQLCEALAVAHDNEIIHRDIKPANLLIDDTGTLKVMDFGIARRLSGMTGTHTKDGFLVGTPHYMAPELLMGKKPDVRTDLFAVGVVLYECLTGRLPQEGDTPIELYTSVLNGHAPRLSTLVPDIPAPLEALIHQQLRFDASARSQTARDLGQRLSELEHSKPAG